MSLVPLERRAAAPLAVVPLSLRVNGRQRHVTVEAVELLADVLRERLGLTGVHVGCETAGCGACTVLLDGESVKPCTVLAVQADGCDITTIEGLASGESPHPVQRCFQRHHALQCGFCTPGMVLAAVSAIAEGRTAGEAATREALEGNLCRCTGYHNIVAAVRAATVETGEAAAAGEASGTGPA
jgi:carbon-monoxide dehydrogenase small subunit